jgi:hypothetical protein
MVKFDETYTKNMNIRNNIKSILLLSPHNQHLHLAAVPPNESQVFGIGDKDPVAASTARPFCSSGSKEEKRKRTST